MNSLEYDDEDVEKLLSQFQDENILKLSVNSHRSIDSLNTSDIQHPVHKIDEGGLESDLVARYAKLKVGRCTTKKNDRSRSGKVDLKRNITTEHEKAASSPSTVQFNRAEDDALSADLEARLQALKSQVGFPPSASDKSTKTTADIMPLFKTNSIANSSSVFASSFSSASASPSLPQDSSSSISYVETVDSAPSNVSPHKVKAIFALPKKGEDERDDDLEVAQADVRKLLRSVRDEVRLEKEERQRQKRSLQESFVEDDASLFDVEEMEDEFVQASKEEDRLARAAEEVVKWAKDAALHGVSESEDELETDKSDILNVSTRNHLPESKQKKGKRWSLFR